MGDKNFSIKKWAEEDRPREKMLAHGRKALSNSELLGIIIGSGNASMSAVELARSILKSAGNSLVALSNKEISELTKEFNGVGNAKAISILAALELGTRMWSEEKFEVKQVVRDSTTLYNVVAPKLIGLPTEEFWAVYLSAQNAVIDKKCISQGSISKVSVDIQKIFRLAFEKNAAAIAIAHNHPSGGVKPSNMDIELTDKIQKTCKLLDFRLLDHIIIGNPTSRGECYYSFVDNGML